MKSVRAHSLAACSEIRWVEPNEDGRNVATVRHARECACGQRLYTYARASEQDVPLARVDLYDALHERARTQIDHEWRTHTSRPTP